VLPGNSRIDPTSPVSTGAEAPDSIQNPITPGNSRINPNFLVPTGAEAPDYI